jgi:hypothetical protein
MLQDSLGGVEAGRPGANDGGVAWSAWSGFLDGEGECRFDWVPARWRAVFGCERGRVEGAAGKERAYSRWHCDDVECDPREKKVGRIDVPFQARIFSNGNERSGPRIGDISRKDERLFTQWVVSYKDHMLERCFPKQG